MSGRGQHTIPKYLRKRVHKNSLAGKVTNIVRPAGDAES